MLMILNPVAHGPQRCLQVANFPAGKFEAGSCPLLADPNPIESPTYTSAAFTDYITTLLSTSYISNQTSTSTVSGSNETHSATSLTRPSWTLTITQSASPTSSTLTAGTNSPTAIPSCYAAPVSAPGPVHESNVTEFAARFCRLHFQESAVFGENAEPVGGVGGPIDGVAYNYSLGWTSVGCPGGVTAQQLPSEDDCKFIYHNDWKSCKSNPVLGQGILIQSGGHVQSNPRSRGTQR